MNMYPVLSAELPTPQALRHSALTNPQLRKIAGCTSCGLFPPSLATNPTTKDLLEDIIHHAPPYLILHPEIAAEKTVITLVSEMFQCASNQQNGYPLQLFGCIYRICHALWNLMQNNAEPWEPNAPYMLAME